MDTGSCPRLGAEEPASKVSARQFQGAHRLGIRALHDITRTVWFSTYFLKADSFVDSSLTDDWHVENTVKVIYAAKLGTFKKKKKKKSYNVVGIESVFNIRKLFPCVVINEDSICLTYEDHMKKKEVLFVKKFSIKKLA